MVCAHKLAWDSNFFGISVGSVEISSNGSASVEEVENAIDRLACELTYVFLPISNGQACPVERVRNMLVEHGGRCYDLKTWCK